MQAALGPLASGDLHQLTTLFHHMVAEHERGQPAAAQINPIGAVAEFGDLGCAGDHNGGVARGDRLAQGLQAVVEIAVQVHGMGCAGT